MKTKYFLIGSILALLVLVGCSKDNDPADAVQLSAGCDRSKSWGEQTKKETDALNAALVALGSSPSKANCESFKKAYIEYIEALEKVNTCVAGEHEAAFLKALKDGKAELANIDCNGDYGS